MKTVNITLSIMVVIALIGINEAIAQWNTSGNNIYNTNSGNVGIGNNSPTTLLHVQKNITEPTITVQNLGGFGGATYSMIDDASGANWKFKATLNGGFKIRDNAFGKDVIVIEPNAFSDALYIKNTGSIGIGTATPASSALVDMSSTTKGILIPRMTQAQISVIQGPADGLQVYCTTDSKLYIFLAVVNQWKEVAYGTGIINPSFNCGSSIIINHLAGTVAPVTKTVTYGTVSGIPGEPTKCWITSNLGADHQATAVNDNTEASAGWYWQFNRMQGYKSDGTPVTPAWTITSISENSNWIIANDPCALELGSGWRLPTSTEWINVDASGNWNDDWNGPWNSPLKMHAAGYIHFSDGSLYDRGNSGDYWSSSQTSNIYGSNLVFGSYLCYVTFSHKANGFSSRCIKDD